MAGTWQCRQSGSRHVELWESQGGRVPRWDWGHAAARAQQHCPTEGLRGGRLSRATATRYLLSESCSTQAPAAPAGGSMGWNIAYRPKGCGFDPPLGREWQAINQRLSLSTLFPRSLKSRNISLGEDFKKQ